MLTRTTFSKKVPASALIIAAAAALGVHKIDVQRHGSRFDVQYELPNGTRFDFGDGATKEEALNWINTSIPRNLSSFPATK